MQKRVLDYLEEAKKAFPDKVVFADATKSITYSDFVKKSKIIAGNIRRTVTGKNNPIPVLIDRNIESIIAFFGIVYSGNYYIPIDANLPWKRISTILETLKAEFIITAAADSQSNDKFENIVSVEKMWEGSVDDGLIRKISDEVLDTDPLYTIFTSGSTGVPKGVMVSHHSVIDLVDNFACEFGFGSDRVFGNQAPFDFDVSVKDIYSTIKNAATMVIVPKKLFVSPAKLVAYLNDNKVNTIIWAVSALRVIENLKVFKKEVPKYLKSVMFSGEVMPVKVLNYWRKYIPDAEYVNLYGPTEITCNCTFYVVDKEYEETDILPIGKAFKNTEILLLNDDNRLCGTEENGEICVRGSSLALGYCNNPEKTKESFCQNPLNTVYPEIIYRTGDIGRMDADGNLYFVSRKDDQIKHMGHRIELGEIEAVANALDYVKASCCIYNAPEKKIYMFYQSEDKCDKEVLVDMGQKLPKYMLPNKLVHMEEIPLNKHGKLDRVRLRDEYFN